MLGDSEGLIRIERPVAGGFGPSAISREINTEIVMRHAEEGAFLWTQRDRAVDAPHYALKDLVALDDRVDAHLNGLLIAGSTGAQLASAQLVDGGAGEVFAAATRAFAGRDASGMRQVLQTACSDRALRRGLISALGWLSPADAEAGIGSLWASRNPAHRRIAIAAYAARRDSRQTHMEAALRDADALVRARACRAVGECGREDLKFELSRGLQDIDEAGRFWSAWSLALFGDAAGVDVLWSTVREGGLRVELALPVALKVVEAGQARQWIRRQLADIRHQRRVIDAIGQLGDPAAVPWLIDRMNDPTHCQRAGEALTAITGVDLSFEDLISSKPSQGVADKEAFDRDLDIDERSPRPDPARVAAWWQRQSAGFSPNRRYVWGLPAGANGARAALVRAPQRVRHLAALELALAEPRGGIFPTRACGRVQIARLASWSS